MINLRTPGTPEDTEKIADAEKRRIVTIMSNEALRKNLNTPDPSLNLTAINEKLDQITILLGRIVTLDHSAGPGTPDSV